MLIMLQQHSPCSFLIGPASTNNHIEDDDRRFADSKREISF